MPVRQAKQTTLSLGTVRGTDFFQPDNQVGAAAIITGMPEEWKCDLVQPADGAEGDIELAALPGDIGLETAPENESGG